MMGSQTHDATAREVRAPSVVGVRDDRELVRLATLAASSHNTQPWLFRIGTDQISIFPDRSRRCPVVDPQDAHLYRSLGCAAENLVHAASMQGLRAEAAFDTDADAVVVMLQESPDVVATELSQALTTRQCTRTAYDAAPLPEDDLRALAEAGEGDGIRCVTITTAEDMGSIATLVERGNQVQLNDDAFRRELLAWVRFNPRAALRSADGLSGHVSGQPSVPGFIGRLLAPVIIKPDAQAMKDRQHIASSAGIAVFLADRDTAVAWVEAGRAYERFSLRADLLGVRSAFINQPVEVPSLRAELEQLLGTTAHAQLLVRFGRAPRSPYSLRRPVEEVILESP